MMECKKALVENDGDFEKAAEALRIKGAAKAAARGAVKKAPAPVRTAALPALRACARRLQKRAAGAQPVGTPKPQVRSLNSAAGKR